MHARSSMRSSCSTIDTAQSTTRAFSRTLGTFCTAVSCVSHPSIRESALFIRTLLVTLTALAITITPSSLRSV